MAKILITAQFNVNQVSASLGWDIIREVGNEPCETMNGLYRLECDDTVQVRVTALSVTENVEVKIVECHLINRPILFNCITNVGNPGDFPYPSPFFKVPREAENIAEEGAVTRVKHFEQSYVQPIELDSLQFTSAELTVKCAGRWETSMFMTVAIKRGAKDARVTSYNVYSFDPETESSSGTVPPRLP